MKTVLHTNICVILTSIGLSLSGSVIGPPTKIRILPLGNGTALWSEQRMIKLTKGLNHLEFDQVPQNVVDGTIDLRPLSSSGSFRVVETRVLRIPDQNTVPANTTKATPQSQYSGCITAKVLTADSHKEMYELFFLVSAIQITTHYIARIAEDKTLDLTGTVTIANSFGIAIHDAAVYIHSQLTLANRHRKHASPSLYNSAKHSYPLLIGGHVGSIDTALSLIPTPVSLEANQTKSYQIIALGLSGSNLLLVIIAASIKIH